MSFYIYENWTAEKKARIHRGECRFCNHGQGIHPNREEGRNGRWHGPYPSYNAALRAARQLRNRIVSNCRYCDPEHFQEE